MSHEIQPEGPDRQLAEEKWSAESGYYDAAYVKERPVSGETYDIRYDIKEKYARDVEFPSNIEKRIYEELDAMLGPEWLNYGEQAGLEFEIEFPLTFDENMRALGLNGYDSLDPEHRLDRTTPQEPGTMHQTRSYMTSIFKEGFIRSNPDLRQKVNDFSFYYKVDGLMHIIDYNWATIQQWILDHLQQKDAEDKDEENRILRHVLKNLTRDTLLRYLYIRKKSIEEQYPREELRSFEIRGIYTHFDDRAYTEWLEASADFEEQGHPEVTATRRPVVPESETHDFVYQVWAFEYLWGDLEKIQNAFYNKALPEHPLLHKPQKPEDPEKFSAEEKRVRQISEYLQQKNILPGTWRRMIPRNPKEPQGIPSDGIPGFVHAINYQTGDVTLSATGKEGGSLVTVPHDKLDNYIFAYWIPDAKPLKEITALRPPARKDERDAPTDELAATR